MEITSNKLGERIAQSNIYFKLSKHVRVSVLWVKCDRIDEMEMYTSITSYIKSQPKDFQPVLNEMYSIVVLEAPHAREAIKYGMPTFVGKKNLVHFALQKNHLGFYPTPSAIQHFEKELVKYKTSKGAVQFPFDKPLPKALIRKMVKFRVKEDSN